MLTLILTGLLFALRTQRALVLENLALRHQLAVLQRTAPRPRLRPSDRVFWVLLARLWHGWAEAVAIVQPETVIRWQRTGFRLFWTWKSRRHGPGRPAIAPDVRALIRTMARANPLWGAPRIHGELQKLGLEISQAMVSKYLVRRRTPPSQTWRTFLDNHLRSLVSVDFFTVPTVMFKVLFVFVVLAHDRRRVLHVNVTDTPTAQWSAQQLVEAFPWDTAPRYLLRDRDAVYGAVFSSRVQALGILEVKTTPRSPWQNPLRRTPHRHPAPRVPRSYGRAQRDPPVSPAARLSPLLPQRPNTPLPGQGRPRAQSGGAPRSRPDRRDAPGRRPPSPVQPPGRIGSGRPVPPATLTLTAGVLRGQRVPSLPPARCSDSRSLATFCSGSVSSLSEERCAHRQPPFVSQSTAMVKQKGQALALTTAVRAHSPKIVRPPSVMFLMGIERWGCGNYGKEIARGRIELATPGFSVCSGRGAADLPRSITVTGGSKGIQRRGVRQ